MKMTTRQQSQHGFSLIEMMITVVIVAILATVAVTSYSSFSCRARQSQAHEALSAVRLAQEQYRSREGSYARTITHLPSVKEYSSGSGSNKYHLRITTASLVNFTVRAECLNSEGCNVDGKDDGVDDIWEMDHLGQLKAVPGQNDCQ